MSGAAPLAVGDQLPNPEQAQIDPAKLRAYALSTASSVGQHKANVFQLALNIDADDWEYLHDVVLEQLPAHAEIHTVRAPQRPEERYTYGTLVPITGLGDKSWRTLLVIGAWELVEEVPHLRTIRVAGEKLQREVDG